VVVDTAQSSFDTVLAVYTGTDPGQALQIAANDDAGGLPPFSRVKWDAVAGTTYRITVDGYRGATGEVQLLLQYTVAAPQLPANDNFADRIVMTGTNWTVQTSNAGATLETGERAFTNTVGGASVWWEWSAPGDGLATGTTRGSTFDTILTIFSAAGTPSVGTLQMVAGNDDDPAGGLTSYVGFNTVSGRSYYLRVDGWKGMAGDIELAFVWEPAGVSVRPANDNFADRALLTGEAAVDDSTLQGATVETGEPGGVTRSVWWRWTAQRTGPVYVTATGAFPIQLAVYAGDALNALVTPPSAERVDGKGVALRFEALAGHSYALRAGTTSTGSSLRLALHAGEDSSPGRLSPAILDAAEAFLLRYDGCASHTAVLEWSTNLLQWEAVATNRLDPSGVYALPKADVPSEFYRLRLVD
jgi:hypothetical protein